MKKKTKAKIIIILTLLITILIIPRAIFAKENETYAIQQDEISFKVILNEYNIKSYLSNNIYYFFLPDNIGISDLNIYYSYKSGIKQISSGTYDSENSIIVNDFVNNDELTITFDDEKTAMIKVIQSDIPSICINLKNDVSLNEVNNGSKDVKYNATCQVIDAINSENEIYDDTIEFKGRGNTTWKMDKKGYQIKFNKKQNLLGIRKWKIKKMGITC